MINASIGSQGGWGDGEYCLGLSRAMLKLCVFLLIVCAKDLWSIIARRIMDNGTVYMIAAGNDGSRGAL